MTLGIIGGVIAILFALFLIMSGMLFLSDDLWDNLSGADGIPQDSMNATLDFGGAGFLGLGIVSLISGVLGLIGGSIVKKRNAAAGIMMVIAAVLSLPVFFNLLCATLFTLGAVFALRREQPPVPPWYAQQAAYGQNPYQPVVPPNVQNPYQPAANPNEPPQP